MFDFKLNEIISWIKDRGYASVILQMPEGLKVRASEASDFIFRNTGAEVTILGRQCYGACDLFVDYHSYADALIHFGHSPIPSMGSDPNVMYVETRSDVVLGDGFSEVVKSLPNKVGLLATVQYLGLLPEIGKILDNEGIEWSVGVGDNRLAYLGQVLGCNCSSALSIENNVDGFLFIGEGDFHPLAAAFGIKKPMLVYNPVTEEVRSMDEIRDRILRKRFAAIESARTAESFLVIVSSKVGQNRMEVADSLVIKLREAGKTASKLILEEISPDALLPYRVDAYINTACPRVAMDDSMKYGKPMLTVTELEILLGTRVWDDYLFDTI